MKSNEISKFSRRMIDNWLMGWSRHLFATTSIDLSDFACFVYFHLIVRPNNSQSRPHAIWTKLAYSRGQHRLGPNFMFLKMHFMFKVTHGEGKAKYMPGALHNFLYSSLKRVYKMKNHHQIEESKEFVWLLHMNTRLVQTRPILKCWHKSICLECWSA